MHHCFLLRLHQRRQMRGHAVEQALGRSLACRHGLVLGGLLGKLDLVPDLEHLVGAPGICIAKHVRVTADELGVDIVRHIGQRKLAGVRRNLRMQYDLHEHVAQLLAQMRSIIGLDAVERLVGFLDHVLANAVVRLLDAPCTGTGTVVSGNEKSLRGLTEQLLSRCARSQRALLDRAMGALKPGGTLVYSTCSILPQENEDALQEALDKHRDCELIPLDGTPSESEARRAQEAGEEPRIESNALTEAIAAGQVSAIANGLPGTLTIPPSRDFEGFYIALIRKRS